MEEFFCKSCIAAMPPYKFWFGFIAVSLASLLGLYLARKNFIRARLIEDMPTSRVRSASQGYVELIGSATGKGSHLSAPLTGLQCLWWRYTIERHQKSGKSSSWRTIDKGISKDFFFMDDDTGLCRVEPHGAEISCLHKKVWYGQTPTPTTSNIQRKPGFMEKLSPIFVQGRYRYTEYLIIEGDPLYLLGHLASDATGGRLLTIDQIAGRLIREWKKDFNQLLVTFDEDGNGHLDEQEWERVRQFAKQEAKKEQMKTSAESVEHTLLKPDSHSLPFLIGSHGQEVLSKRFRWRALGSAIMFLALGSFGTWMFGSRFLS